MKGGKAATTVPVDDLISIRVDIVEKLPAGEGVGAIGALEASGDVESDRLEEYALKWWKKKSDTRRKQILGKFIKTDVRSAVGSGRRSRYR